MHFLLHWMKLTSNLASITDTIANGKSSCTMCLNMPHQATLVYWHLWMIFFLGICLSFGSREW